MWLGSNWYRDSSSSLNHCRATRYCNEDGEFKLRDSLFNHYPAVPGKNDTPCYTLQENHRVVHLDTPLDTSNH